MTWNDHTAFDELKKQIVAMMQKSYPGINPDISEWKGQEITDFQEELLQKANARISEKWFYTHVKNVSPSLPRIDVLNLLCHYIGYANWDEFRFRYNPGTDTEPRRNGNLLSPPAGLSPDFSKKGKIPLLKGEYRYMILIPVAALFIIVLLMLLYKWFSVREYKVCFRDTDTRELIRGIDIRAEVLNPGKGEGSVFHTNDGYIRLRTGQSQLKIAVSSPYYLADTMECIVRKLDNEVILDLKADDYALMIHYFSTGDVDDWKNRREKLNEIFSDDAIICQVIREKDAMGTIFYDKQEFIDKLSMPAGSLRNIDVLGSTMKDGKIKVFRFRLRP